MAEIPTSGAEFGDFFSALSTKVLEGVGKVSGEILPRWVASQLDDQRTDQLFVSTFDDRFADPRLVQTTSTVQRPTKAGLFTGDNILNLSSGGLLLGGAVVLGLILLLRRR